MVKMILCILLLMPVCGYVTEETQPVELSKADLVFRQIVKNKPDIDRLFAFRLSGIITEYAEMHNMDPHRAAAIAMQESTYRKEAKNTKSSDYGLFQINIRTIREYGFCKKRLLEDLEYSVSAYFQVMKDKKKLCERLKGDAWSCYHSKTPSKRLVYKKLVDRYYHVNTRKIAQWK